MSSDGGLRRSVAAMISSGVAGRLAWSLGAAIAARLGLLALAIMIGRQFGPAQYGAFTFATSMALLTAQISVLGWPMLMNRLIPEMLRDQDWRALRGLRDAGDAVVVGCSLLGAGLMFGLSQLDGAFGESFLLAALLTVPMAIAILRRQQLAAFRRPAIGLLFDQGFGAVAAALFLWLFGAGSLLGAVAIFTGGIIIGNLVTFIQVRRLFPPEVSTAIRSIRFGPWMAMALPMLLGMSSKLLMNKMDVLMLAPLSNFHESGLYGAAFRITFLLTFPQVVMMSVVTPLISEAFAHDQQAKIKRLIRGAMLFAALTAIPPGLLLVAFPELALTTLFGAEFAPAAPSLVFLAIGQTVSSLAIPLSALLTMGGREKHYGALNLAGLVFHALLNLVLIPPYGATGAAISTATVYSLLALGQLAINRTFVVGRSR
jgi:O-antigen/teichoic acid export membrane protein